MPKIMKYTRFLILLSLVFLTACAAQMKPLQTQLKSNIHTIDIAQIETPNGIQIQRFSIMSAVIGSSAMVLDTMAGASNSALYEKKAGDVALQCAQLFQEQLIHDLEAQGYQIRYSAKPYWDYFKPSQSSLRKSGDGILHITFKQQGFFSRGLESDYQPTIIVSAELIDSKTRKTLYHDQFATGYAEKDLKLLSLYFGQIRGIETPLTTTSYKNVNALLDQSESSRQDLLDTVSMSASYIAEGLKKPNTSAVASTVIDPSTSQASFNVDQKTPELNISGSY